MQLNPYLNFNGDCEAAFKFYEQCFGGKIEALMTFEGMPGGQIPPEWNKKVMHARVNLGGQVLMGSDVPPTEQSRYEQPRGFSVAVHTKDPAEADRIFAALAQNGQVRMPIQETFFAARFGMCVDRFGIPWMVNCERAAASASH